MSEEIVDEGVIGKDNRHDPFTKVTADAIKNFDNGLSASDLAVFCAICAYLGNTSRKGFPSHETISNAARLSSRTVKRSIKKLEASGYVDVEQRFKGGRQWTNVYHASDRYLTVSRTNEADREDTDDTPQ